MAAVALLVSSCGTPPAKQVYHARANSDVIQIGDSVIEVSVNGDHFDATHAQLMAWVNIAARGVTQYLGKFPVQYVDIAINAADDSTSINGEEIGGASIRLDIGRHVSSAQLADDWTMTHEMLHLAFPSLSDEHHWMNEGLSVYLEPIVRARSGIVSTKRYWRELHEGLENGQPEAGDGGLDHTHSWGRTYWGGTIYWFLADTEIRRQTDGRKSLDDVIRKILSEGGDGSVDWSMQRVLDEGDAESRTHVMHDLYNRLALKPEHVSFDSLWQDLGVQYVHGNVRFNDNAPLAWMRKAITSADGRGDGVGKN
jgi:hypothetical protein